MLLFNRYLIDFEEENGLWRWRYTDSTDGADRYSAEKFSSYAECEKAAKTYIREYESRMAQAETRLRGRNTLPISDSSD